MYIFGGILELTKELNEMFIYNFEKRTFELIGNEAGYNDDIHLSAKL